MRKWISTWRKLGYYTEDGTEVLSKYLGQEIVFAENEKTARVMTEDIFRKKYTMYSGFELKEMVSG